MSPNFALCGSKNPYQEHVSMVPKLFEAFRFGCIIIIIIIIIEQLVLLSSYSLYISFVAFVLPCAQLFKANDVVS